MLLIPVEEFKWKVGGKIPARVASPLAPTTYIDLEPERIVGVYEHQEDGYLIAYMGDEDLKLYSIDPDRIEPDEWTGLYRLVKVREYCIAGGSTGHLVIDADDVACRLPDGELIFEGFKVEREEEELWCCDSPPLREVINKVTVKPEPSYSLAELFELAEKKQVTKRNFIAVAKLLAEGLGGAMVELYETQAGGWRPLGELEVKVEAGGLTFIVGLSDTYKRTSWDDPQVEVRTLKNGLYIQLLTVTQYPVIMLPAEVVGDIKREIQELAEEARRLEEERRRQALEEAIAILRRSASKGYIGIYYDDRVIYAVDPKTRAKEYLPANVPIELAKRRVPNLKLLSEAEWRKSLSPIPEWADGYVIVRDKTGYKAYPVKKSKYGNGYYYKETWRTLPIKEYREALVLRDGTRCSYRILRRGAYITIEPEEETREEQITT